MQKIGTFYAGLKRGNPLLSAAIQFLRHTEGMRITRKHSIRHCYTAIRVSTLHLNSWERPAPRSCGGQPVEYTPRAREYGVFSRIIT